MTTVPGPYLGASRPVPSPGKRLFRVYIDESGDRGFSGRSSPYFVFAAVIVDDSNESVVKAAREQLRTDLKKPVGHVLHWAQTIDKHDARKYAARIIGSMPVVLTYVIVDKASLRLAPTALGSHKMMHNYAARRLLERISWFVRDHNGEAIVNFAHIKNFKYQPFHNYANFLRTDPLCNIAWEAIPGVIRIDAPDRLHLLQVADIAAGILTSAIVPDAFGGVEYGYLDEIQSLIYRRPPGPITTYGLHVISSAKPPFLTGLPWWPDFPK